MPVQLYLIKLIAGVIILLTLLDLTQVAEVAVVLSTNGNIEQMAVGLISIMLMQLITIQVILT